MSLSFLTVERSQVSKLFYLGLKFFGKMSKTDLFFVPDGASVPAWMVWETPGTGGCYKWSKIGKENSIRSNPPPYFRINGLRDRGNFPETCTRLAVVGTPFLSSGPDKELSPIEWGDFSSVCSLVHWSLNLWAIQPGLRPSQHENCGNLIQK